jgi:cell division protein FtsQ
VLARFRPAVEFTHGRSWLTSFSFTGWRSGKAFSLLMLCVVLAALIWLHTQDEWFVYVEDVQFENLTYLNADDLYRFSRLNGWNIFWLRPQEIRETLLKHAYVADVQVEVRLPTRVTITVQEVRPLALWVTNAGSFWLLERGDALLAQGNAEISAPQIIDNLQEAKTPGNQMAVDTQVLTSALALIERLPELGNRVRYNHGIGLNFPLPQAGAWVYWGDGHNVEAKLQNLTVARRLLAEGVTTAQIIDVRYPDRPYLR